MMNQLLTGGAVLAGLIVVLGIVALTLHLKKRPPRKINPEEFERRWKELQSYLSDKKTWSLAIIDADKLLDEALRTKRYKGKTMGERLVAAQHDLRNNNEVWFAHKLRNRLVHEHDVKLRKTDVKDALLGVRGALKDLGAL
ncbi:MAG: hypothetical protein QG629_68 [Patescibacteria group bacterium]|nr:hypothetical protein [Candidatus Saccharibacteria bacterium]MDQ5962986.1 hypothetical protein [Patescibacteria group bacterium]